jgi:hypothetical protein
MSCQCSGGDGGWKSVSTVENLEVLECLQALCTCLLALNVESFCNASILGKDLSK